MERYDTYKDSGVFWDKKIPSHWEIRRLGHILTKERRERSLDAELLVCTNKATVIKKGDSKMGLVSETEEIYQGVKKGDLLIHGMDTWHGAIAVSTLDGMCTPVVHVCTSNDCVKYVEYYLRNMAQNKVFKLISNGVRQNTSDFRSWNKVAPIPCFLPPIEEQQAIASYLDDKCAKIDNLLERKQKQIELLAETKQRVIADAVTRGLNPNVKMKKTGIAWLEEVPEHWECMKMKYIFDERSEKNHPEEPILSATQTEGVILQSKYKGRVVVVNTGFEGLKLVKIGDFVIHLRSFQGGIEIAYDQGIISSAYTVLEPRYYEYSDYYRYLFKSIPFIDLLKICVTGIREGQNINYSKLKQYMLPVPPLSEQQAIVSYINDRVTKIDTLASKLQQEIEAIKEYKQRLISDVVTGQIKV